MALKLLAKPAMLLAHQRTGSTMLSEALSNHPDIFFPREEIYHRDSLWRKLCKNPARVVWGQHYYRVAMFRIMANSLLAGKQGLGALIQAQRPKVVYLRREDLLRQALSIEINEMGPKGHPTHTWEVGSPPPVEVNPEKIAHRIKALAQEHRDCLRWLQSQKLEHINVTYEWLCGDTDAIMLCPYTVLDFLGVERQNLLVHLRKVHSNNLEDLVLNLKQLLSHPVVRAAKEEADGRQD